MTDVLKQMDRFSWRGIEAPITSRNFGFTHDQARHRYIFKDNELVESLGRKNPTWSYTVVFREDIFKGPYRNLFTKVYDEFLAACQDSSAGILEDPVHGAVRAKCVSLQESVDMQRRDGVDVSLEFVSAPDPESLGEDLGTVIATLEGSRALAEKFDQEQVKIDLYRGETPEPTLDPFDAISSVASQVDVASNKVLAKLDDVAFRAGKAVRILERASDPKLAPLARRGRRLQSTALAAKRTVVATQQRPIRILTVASDIGVMTLAASVGGTVRELTGLNGEIAKSPIVKAGTRVLYYG